MKNLVILIGNLGKNPESRPAGTTTVTNFSLATSETFKDSEGKQQKSTEWHNVAAFGKLGQTVAQYLKKGSKVYVEGRLRTSNYMKEGVKHYRTEIVASEVKFLDAKPEETEQAEPLDEAA